MDQFRWGTPNIDVFAPEVTSVDALTTFANGVGSKRRCHFKNGASMVEEVIEWVPGQKYRVLMSETDPMPIKKAEAEISVAAHGHGQALVVWGMDYSVKYGPIGWVLGQTMMKMMMGKVLRANLEGLAAHARAVRTA